MTTERPDRPHDELDREIRAVLARAVARTPSTPPAPRNPDLALAAVQPVGGRRVGLALLASVALIVLAGVVTALVLDRDGGVEPATVRPATPPSAGTSVTSPEATSSAPSAAERSDDPPDLVFDWADDLSVVVQTGDRVVVLHGDGSADWYDPGAIAARRVWQVSGRLVGGAPLELTRRANFHEIADVLGPDVVLLQNLTPGGGEPFFLLPTDDRIVTFDAEHLTLANDRLVGQQRTATGWRPVAFGFDGTPDEGFEGEIGIGEQSATCDCPRLFSSSPTGDTLGWIEGSDLVVLRNGLPERIPLTDGSKPMDLDLTDAAAVVDRATTPATLVDLRSGSAVDLPVLGSATVALGEEPSTVPVGTTTATSLPLDTGLALIVQDEVGVARFGPDGSRERVLDVTGEDVRAFDDLRGGVVVQLEDGQVLRWSPGAEPFDPWAAADWAGPMTIHDVAEIDGVPSYLVTVDIGCGATIDPATTCRVDGFVMALDGSTSTPLGTLAGAGQQLLLSLSDTGVIVGSRITSEGVEVIEQTIAGERLRDFEARGLSDLTGCDATSCDRSFAISADGGTLIWLTSSGDIAMAAVGGDPTSDVVVPAAFGDAIVSEARGTSVALLRADRTSALVTLDERGSWTATEFELRLLDVGN